MTPRVVRTVEELTPLMVVEDHKGGVWRISHGNVASVTGFFGCHTLDKIALPATVLAPLSVTAEQVEALKSALDNRIGGIWQGETRRLVIEELALAALAAMGIPVVEHV